MLTLFLIAICLPVLLWILFIRRRDAADPEPESELFKAFVLGLGVAILVGAVNELVLGLVFPGVDVLRDEKAAQNLMQFSVMMFLVATIEELFKYSVLKEFFYHKKSFNQKADGVFYAVIIALGFATIENIGYFFTVASYGNYDFLVLNSAIRAIFTLMLHLSTTGMIGYALGKQKFGSERGLASVYKMVVIAIIIHATFNVLISVPYGIYVALAMITLTFIFLIRASGTEEENVIWEEAVNAQKPIFQTVEDSQLHSTQNVDVGLLNYIRNQTIAGSTKETISSILVHSGGWSQTNVDAGFKKIEQDAAMSVTNRASGENSISEKRLPLWVTITVGSLVGFCISATLLMSYQFKIYSDNLAKEVYVNEGQGFEIYSPRGWKAAEKTDAYGTSVIFSPSKTETQAIIRIAKIDIPRGTSAPTGKEAIDYLKQLAQKENPAAEFMEESPVVIQKYDAYQFDMMIRSETNQRIRMRTIFVSDYDVMYVLSAQAMNNDWEKFEPVATRSIQTFLIKK